MSHTGTRGRRNVTTPPADGEQPGTPPADGEQPTPPADGEQPTGPDLDRLAKLDESADDLSDEDRAAFAALDEKQRAALAEIREVATIGGFTVTEPGDFRTATTPVRNRKPVQLAMDAVAAKAYEDWTDADRPSVWQRMPVITYFLDPADVAEYRKLIRRACEVVNATTYEKDGKTVEPSGVRVRFGKEFVLSEKMAAKINRPNDAGKTVLAWAAIDKRNVTDRNS